MAPPSKLKAIAQSQGKSIEEMLIDSVKEYGSIYRAALALDLAPNTIHDWKKKQGLEFEWTVDVRLVRSSRAKS